MNNPFVITQKSIKKEKSTGWIIILTSYLWNVAICILDIFYLPVVRSVCMFLFGVGYVLVGVFPNCENYVLISSCVFFCFFLCSSSLFQLYVLYSLCVFFSCIYVQFFLVVCSVFLSNSCAWGGNEQPTRGEHDTI